MKVEPIDIPAGAPSPQDADAQAGWARLKREVESSHRLGFDDADIRWLDAGSCRERVAAEGAQGGLLFEHCAALHPARLVSGLAETVERQGVEVVLKLVIVAGGATLEVRIP